MSDEANRTTNAKNAADFADAVQQERKMTVFRKGELPDHEAELITRDLCRAGDNAKAAKARQAEKELRELVAKMDGRR